MARGLHVHAVAMHTPQVGWCPSGEALLAENEPTKKVPEYLLTLAKSLEDDLHTDSPTMPGCGVATSTLEALEELDASELAEAFESIDKLESVRPAPPSVPVRRSGVVPAGRSLGLVKRDVIPPPPRRPQSAPPSFAFAASLEAFTRADVPFHAEADNEQIVLRPRRHAATGRAAISRTVASAVLALFALFVLFLVGAGPLVIVRPVARTAVTLRAHAERSDPSGTARAHRVAAPAPRPFVANATHFDSRRAPLRPAKTARIIRTSPF